jgi:REP element-mobilizing transposase RayT
MAKDCYHELFLHLVWHTKDSHNLIAPDWELKIHDIIRNRAVEGRVFVHEIGGTRNHIHMVVRFSPTLAVSEWIGRVKGASSYEINHLNAPLSMDWQSGYGVVSFGQNDLPWVVEYVRNQKNHHLRGTIFERLERITKVEG